MCLVAAGILGVGAPARADCSGPGMEVDDTTVAPGEEMVVRGFFFGDACYDTGPPPPGESAIGRPLQDIDLHIFQGPNSWLVATGDADADFEFEVRLTIPAGIEPGEAVLQARYATTSLITLGPVLDVIDAPTVETSYERAVASFGPTTSTTTSSTATSTSPPVATSDGENLSPQTPREPVPDATTAPPSSVDAIAAPDGSRSTGWVIFGVLSALAAAGGVGVLLRLRARSPL